MAREGKRRQKRKLRQAFQAERTSVYRRALAARTRLPPPSITVAPEFGDRVFVRRIRAAVANVPLTKSGGCPAEIAEFIHWLRCDGCDDVIKTLRVEAALNCDHHQDLLNSYVEPFREANLYIGTRIFAQLPEAYRERLLPDYCFRVVLTDEGATIRFGFLSRLEIGGRVFFQPPGGPSVTIDGTEWAIAFTRHAIERACERGSFEQPVPYAHYMQCEAYFAGCVHYEPIALAGGQPALRLFMLETLSVSPERYRDYLHKIAGIENARELPALPVYVLGYCPLALHPPYAIATSFLYPGYDGTPEDQLVRTSGLPKEERTRLLGLASGNNLMKVISEGHHEAIKWYHDNGIPQVRFLEKRLFDWTRGR